MALNAQKCGRTPVGERLAWPLYWAECWRGVILMAQREARRHERHSRPRWPSLKRWMHDTPRGQAHMVACNLRRRLSRQMRAAVPRQSMCGCSTAVLRDYLEGLFSGGMCWENYGEWHIDHIRPCASYDLTDAEQVRECFHYTNLQPMWALDNIRKGARYPT